MVAPLRGFMEGLVTVVIAEVFNTLFFCLKRFVKFSIDNTVIALSPFLNCPRGRALLAKSGFSVFPYKGKKRYFSQGKHTRIMTKLTGI